MYAFRSRLFHTCASLHSLDSYVLRNASWSAFRFFIFVSVFILFYLFMRFRNDCVHALQLTRPMMSLLAHFKRQLCGKMNIAIKSKRKSVSLSRMQLAVRLPFDHIVSLYLSLVGTHAHKLIINHENSMSSSWERTELCAQLIQIVFMHSGTCSPCMTATAVAAVVALASVTLINFTTSFWH